MSSTYEIAVIGSGFAGSLMAMILKRQGHSVILLEKGSHPRVVIGESSTPLSNLLLDSLGSKYDLPFLKPLTKWGTWQSAYPEVGCGLKRGFTFFHHVNGGASPDKQHLLVAASPNDAIADTHWFRADFDKLLLDQAIALGVDYLDRYNINTLAKHGRSWTLAGQRQGNQIDLRADFIIDATGPGGFLHRMLGLREVGFPNYPVTSALYGHFEGVQDYESAAGLSLSDAPYPPDASALHHVFDGGWMWILRFNNGWTSAGLACTEGVAERLRIADSSSAWQRLLDSLPNVRNQFSRAKPKTPFTQIPRLSFRSASIIGAGWAMLPSAAGFIDPLLSTGLPLTLLGVDRLARILEQDWGSPEFSLSLNRYADQTDDEMLATSRLIAALYANMHDFEMFRAVSLLYFTAVSYSETLRRLGRPECAASFLLHGDKIFGPAAYAITEKARTPLDKREKCALREDIYRLIERFDVAGLSKRPDNHCYAVRANDLFSGASKVGATRLDMELLLKRSGFYG